MIPFNDCEFGQLPGRNTWSLRVQPHDDHTLSTMPGQQHLALILNVHLILHSPLSSLSTRVGTVRGQIIHRVHQLTLTHCTK